jgi:hypothetical protein
MQRVRPSGIAILAILEICLGLFSLAGGALAVAGAGLSGFTGLVFLTGLLVALGFLLAIVGILFLAVGWGTWSGQGWAWTIGAALSILGIITGLISLAAGTTGSIVGLILQVIILYYLTRPHVKAFFGKGTTAPVQPVPPVPPTPPQT